MEGFLYGLALQWKLDIRGKSILVTCYIVPILFTLIMGGIFTAIMPEMKSTLIQSMLVLSVSMGAYIGFPQVLIETYGSDIKKVYKANGVPIYLGLVTMFISAFVHLMISSIIIMLLDYALYEAILPDNLLHFFLGLAMFIVASLSIGSILGLIIKEQAKLTMISQLLFLPSIMLSGIMSPRDFLPAMLKNIGRIFPAPWGYQLMLNKGFSFESVWYPVILFFVGIIVCMLLLKREKSE
ncbi:MAG TPA: ABC transporter permease [Erysipelotrichaceae bacterium]|nr:ABC transporter permease [Erysipelotrichaceae bacterium]HQB31981.1 ABC transporter permease [Erysipelotrichaceae bacterium]